MLCLLYERDLEGFGNLQGLMQLSIPSVFWKADADTLAMNIRHLAKAEKPVKKQCDFS
ncbi:MAG: hypothetical protein GY795_42225 [Desulfobacterales bacterium]|nr:hypothetical protein [Desulfobacterales bacterium]